MQVLTAVPQVLSYVVALADEVPEAEDVKAGWLAFAIFIGLILAVAFLGWSLVKQLRKVDAAEEAGLYDPSDKKPAPMPTVEPDDRAGDTGRDDTAPSA
jgi:hypothetical protein